MPDELSTIDLRILEQIQKDASLSTGQLAERVGLSQSPCWRRLQRLKNEGYIRGQVAILDRNKFGSGLTVFAYLKMTTLTEEKRAEFLRKIDLASEIMECHTLFGDRDILIKVAASSMEWYQQFIFNVVLKMPGVVDIQSTVTLSEIKSTTAIPLRSSKVF